MTQCAQVMPLTVYVWWSISWSPSRLHEARDRGAGLGELLIGDVAPVCRRLRDAVPQVLLEQAQRHGLERLRGGGDLGEHVDAVLVVLDHLRNAADLALDAAHPLEVGVLVLGVPVHARPLPAPSAAYPSGVLRDGGPAERDA